ncbi:hypothetical protein [Croceibacterium ferulae]|uniref:hypothetical protein n=1 Tax=Croceibacterium ferulae TaxID=1854641 RepID=UPI000EAD3B09|nr:hypothetical protein [Croceibacterium ferulae]
MNRLTAPFIAIAMLALPAHAQVAPSAPALNLEQNMLLRCSAAFALGGHLQQAGSPQAAGWPPLAVGGREFFVRSSARLMTEAQLSREQIAALMMDAAQDLGQGDQLAKIMPVCLQVAGLR